MTDTQRQRAYWESEHGFRTYDHPVVRFFASQRIEYVRSWLDFHNVQSALDVGCGSGFSTYYMNQQVGDIWAFDRSNRMLADHPLKDDHKLMLADALQLPFADNTFDLAYGWEILHHIAEPSDVIAEMARVSSKYVLVAEPNPLNPVQFAFALADAEHRWVLRYRLSYMRNLFEKAGLQIVHASAGGWIFPNKTPMSLLPVLRHLPYRSPVGISNWVLGGKRS
jgi:ubiquinone/menaquinone biosynthesis C-methylase UbiE